jgi:hypothetical protein
VDLETYRRVVPILAGRTMLAGPPATEVTLTIGFDEVGLLRFADVSIPTSVATAIARTLGARYSTVYHYTLEVTEISGEPEQIDVPTKYVDQSDETLPVASPADTDPAATP